MKHNLYGLKHVFIIEKSYCKKNVNVRGVSDHGSGPTLRRIWSAQIWLLKVAKDPASSSLRG